MVFGYSRISTSKQVHDRQIEALTRYGVEIDNIEKEVASGTKKDREVLTKLLDKLRSGDKLVIHELSRLGRSTKHLLDIIERLDSMEVELVSLSEKIETHSATGRLIVAFLAAICSFEAELTRERVLEGLEAARNKGKKLGRKPTDKKLLDNAVKLYQSHAYSVREVAALSKVSIASIYRTLHNRGLMGNDETESSAK